MKGYKMELNVYSIRDKKTGLYATPFFNHHKANAVRMFKINVNQEGSMINSYPEDYTLLKVGVWNDETGKIEADDVQEVAAEAITLKEEKVEE